MSDEQDPSAATKDETAILCTRCRDYLTVFPIMTSHLETICGRCYHPEEFTNETRPHRNFPFEALSVMYAFPCKYRTHGCTERKRGDARLEHEEYCLYRPMKCFVPNCEWNEIVANLQSHFEQAHPDLLVRSGLVNIHTDSDYEMSTLNLDQHVLYIVQTKFDKQLGTFWLSVVHIGTTQFHKINGLEFVFKSERTTFLFKIKFTDQLKPIDTDTALELDVPSLKSLLGNPDQLTGSLRAVDE